MFTYCLNNPVNRDDFFGNRSRPSKLLLGRDIVFLDEGMGGSGGAGIVGTADVQAGMLLLTGVLVLAGNNLYNAIKPYITIPQVNENKPVSLSEELTDLARSYDIGECLDAAKAMKKANNNKGKIVELYFPHARNGYVGCDRYRDPISENGHHYGYYYNGTVYCNVYPEGRAFNWWKRSFYDAGILQGLYTEPIVRWH